MLIALKYAATELSNLEILEAFHQQINAACYQTHYLSDSLLLWQLLHYIGFCQYSYIQRATQVVGARVKYHFPFSRGAKMYVVCGVFIC